MCVCVHMCVRVHLFRIISTHYIDRDCLSPLSILDHSCTGVTRECMDCHE